MSLEANPYCRVNPPLFLDGLLGQEDELDDVEEGDLEPTPGDISSGASNRTRVPDPEPDPLREREPAPESNSQQTGEELSRQPNEFDRFDRAVQREELEQMRREGKPGA